MMKWMARRNNTGETVFTGARRALRGAGNVLRARYPLFLLGLPPPRHEIPVFIYHDVEPVAFARELEFLRANGIGYREQDVTADSKAFDEMRRKSGQTKAPTLDWRGQILADFGVDELVPFLQQRNVKLEDS